MKKEDEPIAPTDAPTDAPIGPVINEYDIIDEDIIDEDIIGEDIIDEDIFDEDIIDEDDIIEELRNGKYFPYQYYRYKSSNQPSAEACVKHFLTPSNRHRIDIINYRYDTQLCLGLYTQPSETGSFSEGQLTPPGNSKNNNNWSSLDLRPGYIDGGIYGQDNDRQ